ncbi:MAG: hypothetical protein AAFO62_12985, partial [Pseudomonadota bacterium]
PATPGQDERRRSSVSASANTGRAGEKRQISRFSRPRGVRLRLRSAGWRTGRGAEVVVSGVAGLRRITLSYWNTAQFAAVTNDLC